MKHFFRLKNKKNEKLKNAIKRKKLKSRPLVVSIYDNLSLTNCQWSRPFWSLLVSFISSKMCISLIKIQKSSRIDDRERNYACILNFKLNISNN